MIDYHMLRLAISNEWKQIMQRDVNPGNIPINKLEVLLSQESVVKFFNVLKILI